MGRRDADHVGRLRVHLDGTLNTPGSISTAGYDKIASVDARTRQAVRRRRSARPYAAVQDLFSDNGIIKADAVAELRRRLGDFQDMIPFSGQPWKIESWSPDQLVLVPNEGYWGGGGQARSHPASSWCRRPTATPRSTR